MSLYRCHTIMNCTRTCPKGLNPGLAIARVSIFFFSFLLPASCRLTRLFDRVADWFTCAWIDQKGDGTCINRVTPSKRVFVSGVREIGGGTQHVYFFFFRNALLSAKNKRKNDDSRNTVVDAPVHDGWGDEFSFIIPLFPPFPPQRASSVRRSLALLHCK